MLKKVQERILDDLEHWFVPDKTTGKILPSMLVVALAMILEIAFGAIVLVSLGKLLKSVLML